MKRRDLYHLLIHPDVINSCMKDLFDVGCVGHVVNRKESLMIFRLPNNVHDTVSKLDMRNSLSEDDWLAMT